MKLIILLTFFGIVNLFAGLTRLKKFLLPQAAAGLLLCIGICFLYNCTCPDSFYDSYLKEGQFSSMMTFDRLSAAFTGLMLFSALLVILLSEKTLAYAGNYRGDIYGLLFFTLAGAAMLVSFNHLVMLFLGVEILSIPLYVLAGSNRTNLASNEAALKYFLMGAFSTCLLLMGITLIYGSSGSFSLAEISRFIETGRAQGSPLFVVGMILLLAGMVFKIGAVPFHFWTPDVYTGAPTIITLFMATVAKVAGFGAFLIFFNMALHGLDTVWSHTLAWISAATILLGNLTATWQTGFKRMLAYSSIAQGGYVLVGITSNAGSAPQAVYLYLAGYVLASIVTFSAVMFLERHRGNDAMSGLAGWAKSEPVLALALTVALLSLAGIPPLAGFMGKYYLFTQALAVRPWLVLFAILGSAVSIYYYFKPVMEMWFRPLPDHEEAMPAASLGLRLLMMLCTIALLVIGLLPQLVLDLLG